MSHNTHRSRLARTLSKESGWGYQRSLQHIEHADALGLLPANLASADYAALARMLCQVPGVKALNNAGLEVCQCWVGQLEGKTVQTEEGIPHYRSLDEAVSTLAWRGPEGAVPELRTERCVQARCTECDYRFDEEEWTEHFALTDGVLDRIALDLRDSGWLVEADRILCIGCRCESGLHEPLDTTDRRCRNCAAPIVG